MELANAILILLLIILFHLIFNSKTRHKNKNLPPSPHPQLPIIGHLHLAKPPLHRTLHNLLQKHGPIFSLKLGSRLATVVSSYKIAEECFTRNDIVFANRPNSLVGKHLGYNHTTVAGAPYGDHWRNLRRICAQEIFSTSRVNAFEGIRRDEVKRLLKKLARDSLDDYKKVELRPLLFQLTVNSIMRIVAGKRYFGDDEDGDVFSKEEQKRFQEMIEGIFEISSVSNPVDFLPVLGWVDNGRYGKRLMRYGGDMDGFLQGLIEEHRGDVNGGRKSMIGHLLSLQETQPEYYTDQTIKGLALAMILAGTDTTTITMEWAMSNLLNNSEAMSKARTELDLKVGSKHVINESQISKLQYLQNIILETFRLNPAAPFLLPHVSSTDCTVGGYDIPAGTILLVNAWAIHRDPNLWDQPTLFQPERFEKENGKTDNVIPFGRGRRACPGMNLAQRMIGLTLRSLIQCFDWKRVDEKEIDMSEGDGLTMPKAEPLIALCIARGVCSDVIQEIN